MQLKCLKADTKASVESKIQQETKQAQEAEITIIPSQEQAPDNYNEFLLSIIHGKADELVKWLDVIPKSYLNTKIKDGLTPLEFAISTSAYEDAVKQLQIIHLLLENGANPNVITADNIYQLSNLFLKIKPEYLDLVEKIVIKLGNNIDKQDIHGRMLLDAARTNNLELVKILLINGAYNLVNIQNILQLIMVQVAVGNITNSEIFEFINKFIKHIKNFDEAIRNYDSKTLKHLLDEKFININKYQLILGYIPLLYAIQLGNKDIVQILINSGADVNAKNQLGVTPLSMAIHINNEKLAQILIEAGANVNETNSMKVTPLMLTAITGNFQLAPLLIRYGADINAKDIKGNGALMHAISEDKIKLVEILINAGAEVNAKNIKGLTALDFAKARGNKEIVNIVEKAAIEEAKIQQVLGLIHRG